jgi:hypothetical protein
MTNEMSAVFALHIRPVGSAEACSALIITRPPNQNVDGEMWRFAFAIIAGIAYFVSGSNNLSPLCPATFEFCIPTKATKVPFGREWLHEIKYDGYRLRLERDGDRVRLITKGGYDWSKRFSRVQSSPSAPRVRTWAEYDRPRQAPLRRSSRHREGEACDSAGSRSAKRG